VAFNIDWHYALDITDYSDTGMYVSERSLRNYRRMIIDEGLGRVRFPRTACKTPPTRLSGAPGQESLLLVLQGRLAPPCALTSLGTNPEIQEQIPMAVGHRRDQFPSQADVVRIARLWLQNALRKPQHPVFFHSGYSLSEKQSYAVHPDQFRFRRIILFEYFGGLPPACAIVLLRRVKAQSGLVQV
jgi:hypothetical protein